jgi:hypothetical protein
LQHLYGNHKKALARAGIVGEDLRDSRLAFTNLLLQRTWTISTKY